MIIFIVLLSASLAGCHAGITTGRASHKIYTSKITLALTNSSAVAKLSLNNTVNTTYQMMNMTQDNITEFSVLNFVSSKLSDAKHLSKSISAKHIVIIVVSILGFICLIGESYDLFPGNIHRCQAIPSNFTLCYGLGYTQMHLPNLLNHESITEILYELPLWQSLLSLGCHSNARLLLCSILAPVCLQQTPEKASLVSFDNNQDSIYTITHDNKKFIYPCRTLCESVKQSCEPRMITQFGYKWPTMISCDQYPAETELCVSHSSSSTTTTTTTTITTTKQTVPSTTIAKTDLCSMCKSRASISDLLNDYCRSSIVIRTRPIKNSLVSENNYIFANKHKVRYFKQSGTNETNFDLPIKNCSCIKLYSPIILFLSSNGEIIRFISVKRNPYVFKRFRNTIVLRKPRCQSRL
ncbi:unnamed protein product [Adineta steineri]|uniref:FZ domain-containing protein n=1 Tax=Adineta steineri TaxID=433720 RepID=A0A819EV45_9BILA|nr:unnamed protein product [Adineta steineri]CAF3857857.1 unnamed protein product [Adineta steineri]